MAREPFRPVELTEALRPVAAPVDSFVQAQVPSRDTNLQDLARSLSGLGGSLAGMVGQRDKQAEDEDRIRGEAAFHASNQVGFAEGVATGVVPAQYSQAYIRAYKKAEGEVAGGQLEQQFSAAYDTWEGKTSTDPKAYDAFLGGFLKDNIKTNDPYILEGLLPKVRQISANYLQKHVGDASKATQSGFTTALSAQGEQAIDEANTAGLATKQGTDYAGVFSRLETIRDDGLKVGANREQVDQKLIDTVTTAAITKRDPKLLDFLDRKVPGQNYTWSNTPYGRDQKQKTIDTLETMGRKSISEDEKKRREEKATLKDDVTRETIQAITKAPNDPIPEELLARGEKVDADFRVSAIRWRDTIGKGTQTSDPQELQAVFGDLLNWGGLPRVQRAMRDGVFKNPEDLTKAAGFAKSMKEHGPTLTSVFSSDQSKAIERSIRERTLTQSDAIAFMDPDGISDTGLAARQDYRMQLLAWREANPNAGPIEQEKVIGEIGASILGRLARNDTGGATYDRSGIPAGSPFSVKAPEQAPGAGERLNSPAPARPRPAPVRSPSPVYGNRDVQVPSGLPGAPDQTANAPSPARPAPQVNPPEAISTWLNGLPPEMRSRLEVKAAEERKPLMLKAQEVYERGVTSGAITPPAPPAATPLPAQPPIGNEPGKQSMVAPDGTPIEAASINTAADPTAATAAGFQRVVEGAYSGKATFDGTAATLNGRTFTGPVTADQVARQFEGLSENDPKHREALTAFLSKAAGQRIDPAKVPWCAAFVDAVLDASGKPKRGSLRAADFLDYGAATDAPSRGDVVVFKSMARGSSGHVGFVIGIEGDRVRYIAGNDDNKVQEDTLPMSKVAGFRRPPEAGTGPFGGGGSGPGGSASEGFARALSSTAQPAGKYASPELQADPKAARILDLVSGAELNPANAGNYNAFSGNGAATEDLSRRSLDQTIAWSRDRGTSSSATGRFQFMADTLEGLKKDLKLSGSEPFSPALQDRMAVALLNRRGYRDWSTGKITDEEFAANLAKEWASLPNLTTGQSHYAKDGVNKALVSPAQVRAALTGTGAFPAARVEQAAKTLTKLASRPGASQAVSARSDGGAGQQVAPAADAYRNAPKPEMAERLRAINPDPVANSEAVLAEVAPILAAAVRKAQADNPKLRMVVVSRSGEGAEVWPVDAEGQVSFDPAQQDAVGAAIRRSASQLGFGVNILGGTGGGRTHIKMAPTTRA